MRALGVVLLTGCAVLQGCVTPTTQATSGQASGFAVDPTATPGVYRVTGTDGSFVCTGQPGRSARRQFEDVLTTKQARTGRTDTVLAGSEANFTCVRG